MTHRYTEAGDGWLAFVTASRHLFVGAPLEPAVVERLWERLRDERGAAGILETLTADGLFATPPFAFLDLADGAVQAIVRGEASVTSGAEQVSGTGATTWIERRLPGTDVTVALPGSAGPELPIEAGVVRASAFTTGSPTATPPPTAAPEPVAAGVSEEAVVSEETVTSLDEAVASIGMPAPAPEAPAASSDADGYDYLFGATMYRSVQDAAVPAEDESAEDGSADGETAPDGDHDGRTVMLPAGTRSRGRRPADAPSAPTVPSLAVVLPDGTREVLDPVVVIGRAPSVSGVPAGQLPRLVTIPGGDKDISRSHVRIAVEGGVAVVTDLHSRNGTSLVLPTGESQKLRGGEPTPAIVGTVVDLGGGVELGLVEL